MSEDMTIDRDGMAAEYVLGTLDLDERRAAQTLLAQDAEFAAKVKLWERRLGELHLMVEQVEPEAHLWQRIKAKLPELPPKPEMKPEEVATRTELQPAIDLEPEHEPEPALKPEPTLKPEVVREPEPEPRSEPKPEVERNHEEVARKTAAEVNFESAIAAVESALASHGAAAAAKSEAAKIAAAEETPAMEPAAPSSGDKADRPVTAAPKSPEPDLAVVPAAEPAGAIDQQLRAAKRQLAGWRAAALLMGLAVLMMAGLAGLWKYAPDRLPPALQPAELMRVLGVHVEAGAPARKPAPPESQYDE
jgi:hypothetical protein